MEESIKNSIVSPSKDINYVSKDFDSFKNNLINYAKSYYSGEYKDFSENSTGMMFIDMAAYVGDVLSYYIDYQFKEGFMQYATERKNIVTLAKYLGYKIKTSTPATVEIEIYQLVPAKKGLSGAFEPDLKYGLIIKEGMQITSSDGGATEFRTLSQINFTTDTPEQPNITSVYERDEFGQPTFFLLKKTALASSGTLTTKTFTVGEAESFYEITLPETNVLEIESIRDSEGNTYYEVPYLAQDTVFFEEPNNSINNNTFSSTANDVPYILRYIRTSRRFTTIVNSDNTTTIEFGAGSDTLDDQIITPNINNLGMVTNNLSNIEFPLDPANFLKSDNYGSTPSNTILTITYYVGGGLDSNVASNSLNTISKIEYSDASEYLTPEELNIFDTIKGTVNVNNPDPALGGKSAETNDEIRLNGLSSFSSQNRTVTRDDYIIRAYSMPSKFGSIAKVYVTKDGSLDSKSQLNLIKSNLDQDVKVSPNGMNLVYGELNNPLAINMYVLSYDKNKNLTKPNELVLKNLRTYLSSYKILTDGINITSAFIINIGIDFEISIYPNFNKKEVLFNCIRGLGEKLETDQLSIGQPIEIGELELTLSAVKGVKSVVSVVIKNLTINDGDYSDNEYNIKEATIGKTLYPSLDPSIFELKYPNKDIVGRIVWWLPVLT